MLIKLEGNGREAFDALVTLVGEIRAVAFTAVANLNGRSIREQMVMDVEGSLLGSDGEVLHPWNWAPVSDRPACDRGAAGFKRFLKEHEMTREDFQKVARGEHEKWGSEIEAREATEWLRRVEGEEGRSRSRKVGNFLHKQGIKVKPS